MIWAFLIFFILILLIFFSKIKIVINDITYMKEEKNIDISITIVVLNFLSIRLIKFDKEKIDKLLKKSMHKMNITKFRKKIRFEDLKSLKVNIKKIRLYLEYSTNSFFLTTYITPIISTVIGIIYGGLIKEFNERDHYYKINPIYLKKQYLYMKFESIIEVRMWNIINMILLFMRKIK